MPRTPEQNQNIKDRRKAKLLSFALKAFALNGYDHTAVDDITKPAKCSHGLFYHYFDSKEAVFSALIKEYLTGEAELPTKKALELGGTAGLRLIADYAERISKGSARDIAVADITIALAEATSLDEDGLAFAKAHDLNSTLITLVRQGQEEGKVIAGDPAEIAIAFVDMVQGGLDRLYHRSTAPFASADVIYGFLLKQPLFD